MQVRHVQTNLDSKAREGIGLGKINRLLSRAFESD